MSWTNRLKDEPSPYLRQHGGDPVDWYPWGEEAFRLARERDRPIFLSIGYAACHWCHVMQHESFQDPAVAAILNTHFVAIKVDREERPDVDGIYIEALGAITGHAGWPANLFLLPDLRPFTGATYLPPRPAHGLPSFTQVLERVRASWTSDRETIVRAGERLLAELTRQTMGGSAPEASFFTEAARAAIGLCDEEHGGFGDGAKFPQGPLLELLLLAAEDRVPNALPQLDLALHAMDVGGLQDHLGGGFHRYCVDREWEVPHFEKMLFDNAQLVRVYARGAAQAVRRGDRAASRARIRVVRDAVQWMLTDLMEPQSGLFRSSRDADDAGGEGFFYTFTPEEAREAVPQLVPPLPYGIVTGGNFQGRTVLHTRGGEPSRQIREALRELRDRRSPPALDDKRVVAWNGLAIGGLAEAGRLFGLDEWVEAAARCAARILAERRPDGTLPRVVGSTAPGTLDDLACVADGLLDLFQARPSELSWLIGAESLAQTAIRMFGDEEGRLFRSTADRTDIVARRPELHDGAEPSGAGRMAVVLARLHAYGVTWAAEWLGKVLGAAAGFVRSHRAASPEIAQAVRGGGLQLVIAGDPNDPVVRQMLIAWNATWRPQGVVAVVASGADVGPFGLLDGKLAGAGGPVAYVCRQGSCDRPRTRVQELIEALGR